MRVGPGERVRLESRRHGIVLAAPLARALALGGAGGGLVLLGWPVAPAGACLLAAASAAAFRAVLRWERTRVVVTTEKLFVVHGVVRRRAAAVHLTRVEAVEVEQSLLGRLLGYGTLIAGGLEIPYVADPARVHSLLE